MEIPDNLKVHDRHAKVPNSPSHGGGDGKSHISVDDSLEIMDNDYEDKKIKAKDTLRAHSIYSVSTTHKSLSPLLDSCICHGHSLTRITSVETSDDE